MKVSLENKVALVTGGSRGIGSSISKDLAKTGAFVFVNYSSSPEAAQEVVDEIKSAGFDAEAIKFNVANSKEVDEAIKLIKEKKGNLDIVVNNAGITNDGLLIRTKDEDWQKVIDINLTGSFYVARSAAKIMMKQRSGKIINISSVVGEMGNIGQAAYVSSKSGLIGFTKALARELASRNIHVNAITPGFIETKMTEVLDDKIKQEHYKNIPLSRYGQVADISNLVCFLGSDCSNYITGQVIGVNGGMYM